MKSLVIHRLAKMDLDQAIAYYEQQRRGLGLDLETEVRAVFSRIREFPKLGSPYKDTEARFCLVHRFPYVIYYVELEESIWIMAVAHGSRRPDYWKRQKVEGN